MTSLRRVAVAAFSFAFFFATAFATLASAESPSISSIAPVGGQRGTELDVRINGNNLGDNPQLVLYHPGITVKSIATYKDKSGTPNSNVAMATLSIAPDCRLGLHSMRVRTDSGLSPMPVLFSVGPMPIVKEVEPNNDSATAQVIEQNVTIDGSIGNEDLDYFVVEAKKGQRLSAEVEAMRLGRSAFDPYIAILDSENRVLARSDDEAFGWYDAVVSTVAPADGKYFVMIRECTYGIGSVYRLHIGSFPRPTAMIPAGGRPGQKMEVTYLGEAIGPWKRTITVPSVPDFYSTHNPGDRKGTGHYPEDKFGASPTPLFFRIVDLDNVIEAEPNDDAAAATVGPAPIAFNGVIAKPGDVDCFAFEAKKGQVYDVRVHGRSIRSPLDSVLKITRKSNGSSMGENDDSGSPDSYLRLNCSSDDTYVVHVRDMLSQGGDNYVYRVEVSPVQPNVYLTAAEKVQYIDTTCYVPAGNRGAVVLNVTKRDTAAAELAMAIAGLPKGMKVETVEKITNQTQIPLLITADATAEPAEGVLDITLNSTDDKNPAFGRFIQASQLIRVNNRSTYEFTTERFSTAVTKKAPFKIEVEVPKVPLVRNGSMDLKVRAIREPGFTAAIDIRMLYSPAGTAAAVSAQIPEGKDEGTLFVNAGPTAEVRTWPIVVLGSASAGTGRIEVASAMTPMQIGEPYFELAFKSASVEQGKELQLTVPVTNLVEFKGKATAQLIGLPDEATCEPIEITQDSETAVFTVKTTGKTPVGRHKAIMCSLIVKQNGEPINHTLGPGEIRVDPPTRTRPTSAAAVSTNATQGGNGSATSPSKPAANVGNNKNQK